MIAVRLAGPSCYTVIHVPTACRQPASQKTRSVTALTDPAALTSTLTAEVEDLVRSSYLPERYPAPPEDLAVRATTGGPDHKKIVMVSWALANAALVPLSEAMPGADLRLPWRVLDRVRGWAIGVRPLPATNPLSKRLAQRARDLEDATAPMLARCQQVRDTEIDGLSDYVKASVDLLHARALHEITLAVHSVLRVTAGQETSMPNLVAQAAMARSRLVAAKVIRTPWTLAQSTDFGDVMGAIAAPHVLVYARRRWELTCKGLDVIEHAAGSVAFDQIGRSCAWFIAWAMHDADDLTQARSNLA